MTPWPDHLKDTVEARICTAIAGDDERSFQLRLALLTIYHAAQSTETELAYTADWLANALEDLPHSLRWFGPVIAEGLAEHLEQLARELRKASTAIDAVNQNLIPHSEGADGANTSTTVRFGVRQAASSQPPRDSQGDDCPF